MTTPEPHCPGEPSIAPWRHSAHGTVYAVQVCACGAEARYVELEVAEHRLEGENALQGNTGPAPASVEREEEQ